MARTMPIRKKRRRTLLKAKKCKNLFDVAEYKSFLSLVQICIGSGITSTVVYKVQTHYTNPLRQRRRTMWAKLLKLCSHRPTKDDKRMARAIENFHRSLLRTGKMNENHVVRVS